MSDLELYKYITENNIEWRRELNNGVEDVLIFPLICQVKEFSDLIKSCVGDEGIECRLMDGYISIWMNDICEYYGLETNKIFIKK